MILTPIFDHDTLRPLLAEFVLAVAPHPLASRVLARITAHIPDDGLATLSTDARHHAQALDLCRAFGLAVARDLDPADGLTWDGYRVAGRMEPSVLIHEVAHYQCAAPDRRALPDFGLGVGPESGRGEPARLARRVWGVAADVEEALASLLGILWEAEYGQPAILAFLEQNWLEGGAAPHNVAHLVRMAGILAAHGLIGEDGRPRHALRTEADATFFAPWTAAGGE
jgi:hypothetical protein